MTLFWCSSKFAQLYKLSLCNIIKVEVAREPSADSGKKMPKEPAVGTGRIIEQNRQEVEL